MEDLERGLDMQHSEHLKGLCYQEHSEFQFRAGWETRVYCAIHQVTRTSSFIFLFTQLSLMGQKEKEMTKVAAFFTSRLTTWCIFMAPSKLTARVCNLYESESTYKQSLLFLVSGLLVKRMDNTIHRRNKYQLEIKVGKRNCSIHWIVIYPVHIEQTEPD